MDDIVERLREGATVLDEPFHRNALELVMLEAADEIERLRTELADAIKAIDRLHDERRRLEEAQNELRAARIKIKRQRVELARLNKAHRIVWGAFIVSTQRKNELRPTGHYGPLDAAVKMMSKETGWLTWAAGLAAKKRSGSDDR